MKQIYLIRHGQTDLNKKGITQGQEIDIELNDKGLNEALLTAKYLNEYRLKDNVKFDCIYSSPSLRTKKTAEITKNEINFNEEIIYNDNLKEMKKGSLSGLDKNENIYLTIKKFKNSLQFVDPIDDYTNYESTNDELNKKFNIGIELESEIEERVMNMLDVITKSQYQKIIVVSHFELLERMIKIMFNISKIPHGDMTLGNNCWISYILYDSINKSFKMISPPNTKHLGIIY